MQSAHYLLEEEQHPLVMKLEEGKLRITCICTNLYAAPKLAINKKSEGFLSFYYIMRK